MKTKLFRVLAILTVFAFVLATGGVIYADSHADSWAEADGSSPDGDASACDSSYAEATANADGNIYFTSDLNEEIESSAFAKATAISNATSDEDSEAEAEAYAAGAEYGTGWATAISNAIATNGGYAYSEAWGFVEEREGGGEARVNATGNAIADGDLASAYVYIGEYDDDISEFSEEGIDWEEDFGAYISADSSGSIDLTANATGNGGHSDAEVDIDQAAIWDSSSGSIDVIASAVSEGDSRAFTNIEYVGLGNDSEGVINVAASATATGEDSVAVIDGAYAYLEEGSSGSIDSSIDANATDGGYAFSTSDIEIYDSSGTFTTYSTANADGNDSEAYSDVYVYIEDGSAAGLYYDIDGNSNSIAIGILYSDGNDVWVFSYSYATNGGSASTEIDADGKSIDITAIVGEGIPNYA